MFVSMGFGAMIKHIVCAGIGGFAAGVGAVLLYQKIKDCSLETAAALVQAEERKEIAYDSSERETSVS